MQIRIPLSLFASRTLPVRSQLGVSQDPLVLFPWVASQQGYPQHKLMSGTLSPQVQDFALLVELPEFSVNPFLQTVEVLLDGSMTLWHITAPPSFVSSSNLLRVYSDLLSRSWIKMLNGTKHSIETCGACILLLVAMIKGYQKWYHSGTRQPQHSWAHPIRAHGIQGS